MRQVLFLNALDNIAVCLSDISIREVISQEGIKVIALESIPRGHKISIRGILKDEGVIKYGERMGHATMNIPAGAHVHTHNVLGDRLSTEPA